MATEKHKTKPPGRPPDKEIAPPVGKPDGLKDGQSFRRDCQNYHTNDTTRCQPLPNFDTIYSGSNTKESISVDHPYGIKNPTQQQPTKPGDDVRSRLVLNGLRQQLELPITNHGPAPIGIDRDRPPPITPRQTKFLISLVRRVGQREYQQLKANLGITAKVPDLTKAEAYRLINNLVRGNQ